LDLFSHSSPETLVGNVFSIEYRVVVRYNLYT
jgi:hypothetical protein